MFPRVTAALMSVQGRGTCTPADHLCPFQVESASAEDPAVAASGGGATTEVSNPSSFGRGGEWGVRSDQGALGVRVQRPASPSDLSLFRDSLWPC